MATALERKKSDSKISDYKKRADGAYGEALQYLSAMDRLDKKRCEWQLISPTITMGTLACELFSKAILYAHTEESVIKGHGLRTFYDEFPNEIRIALPSHIYDKERFEDYVSDINELFEVWRYCFEYEKRNSHYSFVIEYAKALKTECEKFLIEKQLIEPGR